MPGKAAIVLGHSHLSSIVLYLNSRPSEIYGTNDSIQYYVFDTMRMGTDFQFSVDSGGGRYILNPSIMEMVDQKVPADRERIYISMFGGNAHNVLTLKEHPRRFDFIFPDRPCLPLDENAEFITYGYMEHFVRKLAESYLLNMVTLQNSAIERGCEIFHFQSPPPVKENSFILSNLEDWFKSNEPFTVAAPYLRYKMWLTHSSIIRNYCAEIGVSFLETPTSTQDDIGFLLPEHGRDSTHAGPSFGGAILKHFEQQLAVRYDGWAWL